MSAPRLRRLLFGLAALAAGPALAAAEPAVPDLEALMRGMASAPGVVAEFRESRQVGLLREPIESRGVLHFVPPDRLVRRVTEPAPSSLVIDGRRMWLLDGAGPAPADLSADPAARQFVENFVVLFGGDLEALRARYETRFEADADGWELRLRPRDAMVRRFVEGITMRGRGRAMREMVVEESDGDRTTTTFPTVDTDHRHSEAELRELFGEPTAAAP